MPNIVVPVHNVPLLNADGTINAVWYRFFVALATKLNTL